MHESPLVMDLPVRKWHFDRAMDVAFAHRVPAMKWDYFAQRVRPLGDESAEVLWAEAVQREWKKLIPGRETAPPAPEKE